VRSDPALNDDAIPVAPVRSVRRGPSVFTILAGVLALWVVLVGGVLVAGMAFGTDSAIEVLDRREVRIELLDFDIKPDLIEVGPHTELTFLVQNLDNGQHDLQISPDVGTGRLKPGESKVLSAGVVERSYFIWCSIKGHREQGMEARVELIETDT